MDGAAGDSRDPEWELTCTVAHQVPRLPPNDKKRVECCGIPLKPKPGLNGAPSLRCSDGVVTLHLTPEAAVERAVLDGFCNVAYGNVWPCIEICDGAGDLQYAVVGARA